MKRLTVVLLAVAVGAETWRRDWEEKAALVYRTSILMRDDDRGVVARKSNWAATVIGEWVFWAKLFAS